MQTSSVCDWSIPWPGQSKPISPSDEQDATHAPPSDRPEAPAESQCAEKTSEDEIHLVAAVENLRLAEAPELSSENDYRLQVADVTDVEAILLEQINTLHARLRMQSLISLRNHEHAAAVLLHHREQLDGQISRLRAHNDSLKLQNRDLQTRNSFLARRYERLRRERASSEGRVRK
ncbi:hypothetical protein ANO11243_038700 [Dothideomycetidae sp. 11243]|nr:hypothetical protein ANO11243_038700 [fungal sp. No.11243]